VCPSPSSRYPPAELHTTLRSRRHPDGTTGPALPAAAGPLGRSRRAGDGRRRVGSGAAVAAHPAHRARAGGGRAGAGGGVGGVGRRRPGRGVREGEHRPRGRRDPAPRRRPRWAPRAERGLSALAGVHRAPTHPSGPADVTVATGAVIRTTPLGLPPSSRAPVVAAVAVGIPGSAFSSASGQGSELLLTAVGAPIAWRRRGLGGAG